MNEFLTGFGNQFETEAEAGALPRGRNSPKKPAMGLYAEQINGSAFTAPRGHNLRSWLYRIRPSAVHGPFAATNSSKISKHWLSSPLPVTSPTQQRWDPMPSPQEPLNFLQSLHTVVACGSLIGQAGGAVHLYGFNQSMEKEFFFNADAEMVFVPQAGDLKLVTELGRMTLTPGEIAVIPRGIRFQVLSTKSVSAGYVFENYGAPMTLPELGPIGANGLANPRDFIYTQASYHDEKGDFSITCKYQGQFFSAVLEHNPLDVVAWHGNLAPYRYDLKLFNTIGSISFDHPDPSIFTVLTSPSDTPGVANADFVIFPDRWLVAENTFRPPYYHRNYMNEYMGLIYGSYDAKPGGFSPGGGSLHNCMIGHGPDADAFDQATHESPEPQHLQNTMAFMFESRHVWNVSPWAWDSPLRQRDYLKCWQGLKHSFDLSKC